MPNTTEIVLHNDPATKTITARCNGEILHADRLDILDAAARNKFATELTESRPGIDPAAVKAELLRLVGDTPKKAPQPELPWKPFPTGVLPEILRDYVFAGSESIGCDPSMIALPVLATVAGAIGTARRIHLRGTWHEFPIVWAIIIAKSGTLKSPALDFAVESLRGIQEKRFVEHDEEMAQYESAMDRWKRENGKGGRNTYVSEKPEKPICVRHIISDATVESVIPILAENPRGVLLVRDELGGWMRSFDQYKGGKGGDLQNWLEMHRGGAVIVDRKTQGTLRAPRAAVSVCGTVQPGTLARLLTAEFFEAGLTARLMLCSPPNQTKRWTDAVPDRYALDAYHETIAKLTALEHDDVGDSIALPMTDEARAEYVTFYNDFAREQSEADDDNEAAAMAKIEGCIPRLSLLFELVSNPQAKVVGANSMRSAIIVGRWFSRESKRVYEILRRKPENPSDDLTEWVRGRGGSVTVRDLTHGLRRFRDDADGARATLSKLADAGLGHWRYDPPGPRGGPPTERFILGVTTVTVTVTTTPTEVVENGGYGDGDAVTGFQSDNPPIDEAYADALGAEADSVAECGMV